VGCLAESFFVSGQHDGSALFCQSQPMMNATCLAGRYLAPTPMPLAGRALLMRRYEQIRISAFCIRITPPKKSQNCQTNPNRLFVIKLAIIYQSTAYDKISAVFPFYAPKNEPKFLQFSGCPASRASHLFVPNPTWSNPVRPSPTWSNHFFYIMRLFNIFAVACGSLPPNQTA
jgi:hypothetical protein